MRIFIFILAFSFVGGQLMPVYSQETEGGSKADPSPTQTPQYSVRQQPGGSRQGMSNPDVSMILRALYYSDSSNDGPGGEFGSLDSLLNGISDEGLEGPKEGFDQSETELIFSANIDPYFKGWAIISVAESGAEAEEAVIQTTSLPSGLQIKLGKFLSDFGRVNSQHPHSWNFSDRSMVHEMLLGGEGLNEAGLQLSWLAPTEYYMLLGVELLDGENRLVAGHSDKEGPRLATVWAKIAPALDDPRNAIQFGMSGGFAYHQEQGDLDLDGSSDALLSGMCDFMEMDLVYKYDDPRAFGVGDVSVQFEYLRRNRALVIDESMSDLSLEGNELSSACDGFFAEVVYGFAERWRAGLRCERVGLFDSTAFSEGVETDFEPSDRVSFMVDWSFSEFSRIRFQPAWAAVGLDDGRERLFQFTVEFQVSIGAHGAHKF